MQLYRIPLALAGTSQPWPSLLFKHRAWKSQTQWSTGYLLPGNSQVQGGSTYNRRQWQLFNRWEEFHPSPILRLSPRLLTLPERDVGLGDYYDVSVYFYKVWFEMLTTSIMSSCARNASAACRYSLWIRHPHRTVSLMGSWTDEVVSELWGR